MSLPTNVARWRRRYLAARAERELDREARDRLTATRVTLFQRHPILLWEALTTRHRWVIRSLMAITVLGMLWTGLGIYAAVPAGSPLADYSAAAVVAFCGGPGLAVCMYAIDTLIHAEARGLWPVAVAEAVILALALIAVIAVGVDEQIPANHMLINVLLVGLTAMSVALAWSVSSQYHEVIKRAAAQAHDDN